MGTVVCPNCLTYALSFFLYQLRVSRHHRKRPANSALKLTVRRRFSRRPSRLLRLEFARRRATCIGIIGCAASGAPLDAGRPPAARNLTSRRWADLSDFRRQVALCPTLLHDAVE